MSKRLDPKSLAGAFAKGPPTSLDFLIPQRGGQLGEAEQSTPRAKAPKASAPKTKAKAKAKLVEPKTPCAKPKKTRRAAKAKAKVHPAPTAAPALVLAVVARDVWTPGVPAYVAATWREALTQRVERVLGRILSCVLP